MKVRLSKIQSNHRNMRSPDMVGELRGPLTLGESITVVGKALDPKFDIRIIMTSPVQRIEGDLYYTENSVYRVEHLKENSDVDSK